MAGFFGLFDYSKEGPGVDKNAPKKKGFIVFFEIYFRKFWKLICANLLYVVVALPVLSVGLAQTGLCYITRNFAREKHAFISGDFFDTIKKNWKQALVYGILNVLLTVIIFYAIFFYNAHLFLPQEEGQKAGFLQYIMSALSLTVFIVFSFMKFYVPMLIITFKLKLKQILKNSLIFAFAGLKRNLLIGLVLTLCYAAAVAIILFGGYVGITVVLFLYILLFPAFRSYLIQYNVFPVVKRLMIDPYYKEHPGEDLEAKRALNLEDLDSHENDEEPVFRDMGRTVKEDEPEEAAPSKKSVLPKQYTEQELRHGRRIYKKGASVDDDDDTI